MTAPFQKQLSHAMYDAYCEAVGGKAFNGDPLPDSSEFFADPSKTKQANGWRKAAECATEILIGPKTTTHN